MEFRPGPAARFIPDSLFEHLSKSYRLGLLSNTDPIHVAHLEATYSFFRYFPKPCAFTPARWAPASRIR